MRRQGNGRDESYEQNEWRNAREEGDEEDERNDRKGKAEMMRGWMSR